MGDRLEPENWEAPQKILVILAHPDDPEFFVVPALPGGLPPGIWRIIFER